MEESMGELLSKPEVIWFFIGLLLMLSEFLVPGLIILFFGLGCWIASLAVWLAPGLSFTMQLLIFLGSSVILLLLLRRKARGWIGRESDNSDNDELIEEFIGKKGIAETAFKSGGRGKVIFKGTTWEAESDHDILPGQAVRITGKESIKLIIEPF